MATWYGYRTLWVNRYLLPFEELGTQPICAGFFLIQPITVNERENS